MEKSKLIDQLRNEFGKELVDELKAEMREEIIFELQDEEAAREFQDGVYGNENAERELINHEMNSSPSDNSDHFANYHAKHLCIIRVIKST